ncbi:MAG: HAD family hydrolase [Anaerolineae bacterium]
MLKAVTLDFWGTLVDDRHGGAAARIDALAKVLPGVSRERVSAAYTVAWARFMEAGADGWGLAPAALLSMTLDELAATLRPPAYQAVLSYWETAHVAHPPRLLPGVRDMLVELRRQGLLIALISDTGATPGSGLRDYLAIHGLRSLLDWVTFSNETGVTKRQPQAFRVTLAALGVEAHHALHVGDTPATDICGAQAAGLRAALTVEIHDRRSPDCHPDFVLEHLADLPAALARLSD